jgi:hypothetical protein
MTYFKQITLVFFLCFSVKGFAQNFKEVQLIGNWDLTVYELKGKDQQMNLLFDNSNIDSSFNVLVTKMSPTDTQSQNKLSADSLALLKKQYHQQVNYLSKSYIKFFPQGKCKHNLINEKQKFKTLDDTYTVKDNTVFLGDGSKYKIVSLSAKQMMLQSNSGKVQLTYTKQ